MVKIVIAKWPDISITDQL